MGSESVMERIGAGRSKASGQIKGASRPMHEASPRFAGCRDVRTAVGRLIAGRRRPLAPWYVRSAGARNYAGARASAADRRSSIAEIASVRSL